MYTFLSLTVKLTDTHFNMWVSYKHFVKPSQTVANNTIIFLEQLVECVRSVCDLDSLQNEIESLI